ncbi:hypothetical protein BaRGS_00016512 [Batillaria attramentaria]|uniref:Secreted protein n=1 Tax=Batillaria attramentaria TaxID=370345 RepID=A0ABD0KYJ7_9CAEN
MGVILCVTTVAMLRAVRSNKAEYYRSTAAVACSAWKTVLIAVAERPRLVCCWSGKEMDLCLDYDLIWLVV